MKSLVSRILSAFGLLFLAGAIQTMPAYAQEPMRIVIGAPVGAGADAMARVLAEGLAAELKTPVVVDARPGAGGAIAARFVKTAPADGRTLLLVNSHMLVTLPLTTREPGYDPARDFRLLGQIATLPLAVVVPAGTFNSLREWLNAARTQPAVASYAIPAPGSDTDFLGFKLAADAGAKLTSVPYRGAAPMIADLLGRQVPAGITTVPDLVPHHKAGKLKVLAVSGAERFRDLPDVPTFKESGFQGLEEIKAWGGLAVAAGTPASALDRLRSAMRTVMLQPRTAEQLLVSNNYAEFIDHETMGRRHLIGLQFWGQLIKESGFVPQ
jgi:tripartite-type tricarboxylate transporter receptor subunit TctC